MQHIRNACGCTSHPCTALPMFLCPLVAKRCMASGRVGIFISARHAAATFHTHSGICAGGCSVQGRRWATACRRASPASRPRGSAFCRRTGSRCPRSLTWGRGGESKINQVLLANHCREPLCVIEDKAKPTRSVDASDALADDAPRELAVTRFDLQRAGHGLPHVRQALPDVQHWDVHEGHVDGSIGPQPDVAHGALVRLHVAAAEQLRWPVDTHTRAVGHVRVMQENTKVALDYCRDALTTEARLFCFCRNGKEPCHESTQYSR